MRQRMHGVIITRAQQIDACKGIVKRVHGLGDRLIHALARGRVSDGHPSDVSASYHLDMPLQLLSGVYATSYLRPGTPI